MPATPKTACTPEWASALARIMPLVAHRHNPVQSPSERCAAATVRTVTYGERMRAGIDLTHLSPDVRPQDDLFGYVNGGWLATAEIPADRGRYGAFDMLREASEAAVRTLVERSAAESAPAGADHGDGSAAWRVGALYRSFMDTAKVHDLGWAPVLPDLRLIAAAGAPSEVVRTAARLQRHGGSGLIDVWASADAGDPGQAILYLNQGGLGLPDEEYYRAEQHADIRRAYVAYLDRMLTLAAPALAEAGLDLGDDAPQRVMALETAIAQAHWDRVKARDAVASYTRLTHAELLEATPGWDWSAWAQGLGLPPAALERVVVRQPDTLAEIARLLAEHPIADWRAWLTTSLLGDVAPYLSDDVVETRFDFYGRTLSGVPELRERWKRGVALVESLVGEDAGAMYVAEHYPARAAERMDALVAHVIEAFRARIGALEWMGEQTRARALEKLAAFRPKIGRPVRWRDYSAFTVDPGDLLGNVRRGHAVETDHMIAKIGRPVDRDEWLMTPQTVNAYYHPTMNEIVFPAAILQPPFFDVEADDAVNYGGIGAVIAHEIGHGFDDQGSRYDGTGALSDWWTEADRAAFDARAQQLIAQFDALAPREVPDEKVNGALTVGENIGDLCGLEMALAAYRLAGNGSPLEGWSAEQRFFLGWGQVWGTITRAEEARRLLAIDPHSPPDLRANLVRNVDAFHTAFGTGEGDGMWLAPEDRVRIF